MLSIVVARGLRGEIGLNNKLLWHIPGDLKWFKELTLGKNVVMGRKTYQSIGKPLKGRKVIVVTRDRQFASHEVYRDKDESVEDINEIIERSADEDFYICGGGEIYRQTIDFADYIYETVVDSKFEHDTSFPKIDLDKYMKVYREDFQNYDGLKYRINIYRRVQNGA